MLFCDNETNARRFDGRSNASGFFKDAFDEYLLHRNPAAVNPARVGTTIKVYGTLVDKYLRRGREYLVMECRSVDEDGIEICRDRRTIIIRYAKHPD